MDSKDVSFVPLMYGEMQTSAADEPGVGDSDRQIGRLASSQ